MDLVWGGYKELLFIFIVGLLLLLFVGGGTTTGNGGILFVGFWTLI